LLAFTSLALAAADSDSSACSFPISTLDQQIERGDEIFIATLVEAKVIPKSEQTEWPYIDGRFETRRVLKGREQPKNITLTTGLGRGDCGIGMSVLYKYVIFKGTKDTGIGDPSGTQLIEDFQEEELAAKIQAALRRQRNMPEQK
jgi:hypothetical protein